MDDDNTVHMGLYMIDCYDSTDKVVSLQYDSLASALIDPNGFYTINKTSNKMFSKSFTNQIGPIQYDGFRLIFGSKCNFNCKYCAEGQNQDRLNNTNYNGSLASVNYFLDHVDQWCSNGPKFIDFRGGEPGVYVKLLTKLIPACRKKWPSIAFGMLTNGSRITESFADLLIENKVSITVSHDSYGQSERGIEPLDDPKSLKVLQRIYDTYQTLYNNKLNDYWTGFKFHVTMNKIALDPLKAVDYIRKKIDRDVLVTFHMMGGMGNGLRYNIPDDDLYNILGHEMVNAVLAQQGPVDVFKIARYMTDTVASTNVDSVPYFCSATDMGGLFVDLNGHIFRCQNFASESGCVGSVYDPNNIQDLNYVDFRDRQCCNNCPFTMLCRGSCCLYKTGNYFEETCRYRFYYSIGLFSAAIIQMTGLIPFRIRGKIVRPVYELIESKHGKYQEIDSLNLPLPNWEKIFEYGGIRNNL